MDLANSPQCRSCGDAEEISEIYVGMLYINSKNTTLFSFVSNKDLYVFLKIMYWFTFFCNN